METDLLEYLTDREKEELNKLLFSLPVWIPDPRNKPQCAAYESEADIIGYGGSAGGGKALTLDTPLATINGWKTMREIQPGDMVFDEQGLPCSVLATSSVMYNHKICEVVFDDGSVIKADAEHLWLTLSYKERTANRNRTNQKRQDRRANRESRSKGKRPDVVIWNRSREYILLEQTDGSIRTTEEIMQTVLVNSSQRINHAVPVAKSLKMLDINLPIPAYTLGAWLGDGHSIGGGFVCADAQILEEIKWDGYDVTKRSGKYEYGILGLQAQLKSCGLINNKHIPDIYLRASEQQRLDLLAGLMDTDGTALLSGSCEFYTTNRNLAFQTHELLLSLGIKCNIGVGRAILYGKDCGEKYRIKFTTSQPVFRLKRKLDRQIKKERGTQKLRYIVDVRKVPSEPVRCIQVGSPSHLYLAGQSMIPTHNSDLLLGFAGTKHYRSVIFRRVFPLLEGIVARSREIFNAYGATRSKDSYNESLHRWELSGGVTIRFAAMQYEEDKKNFQGRPFDFYGFDEVTEFTESQVRFVIGWNRSTRPGQKCRVVLVFNPPMDEAGEWVVHFFAPWLDSTYPNPAKDGELRWFAMIDGEERETSQETFEHNGEQITPKSRTFFHAQLSDNVILQETGYGSTIDAMPEPVRSLLKGKFGAYKQTDPFQVINTAWVKAAQERWVTSEPTEKIKSIGIDVARGGQDKTVISTLRLERFDELKKYPGSSTPNGQTIALLVENEIGEQTPIIGVDVIGVGGSVYDHLIGSHSTLGVNFGAGSNATDKSGKFRFANLRAEVYWRFREALDPDYGATIALPPDTELLGDLCAPKWSIRNGKIYIESKDEIIKRLGRSPDCADSVVIAWWVASNEPWTSY